MIKLPTDASSDKSDPFEPNDKWLATASKELQIAAMRRWFLERYEDPANETPWDGEDKEYVFIWGGPYDPNDEIQSRFGGIVDLETMHELIVDLWSETGNKWAPIHHEGAEYKEYVSHLIVSERNDPHKFLEKRITEIFAVLDAATFEDGNRLLLYQMAHGSLIAALEAYLADTVTYWTDNNDQALRRLVSTNKDFQSRKLSLAEVFERMDQIKPEVKSYLADLVWHRLDKVKPIIASGLNIQVPDISDLMEEVQIRHDIVHRAGRRSNGHLVYLEMDDLIRVRDAIRHFVEAIEVELNRRFPIKSPTIPEDPL